MKYLNEKIKSLPKNCLFNKGKVGCGGTTMAIESDEPYVIAVPFCSLTFNKVAQYPNERYPLSILGVYEGVSVDSIKDYLSSAKTPKIIVTYDSLPKVVKALDGKESDINLLIDEYHILFKAYAFRNEAIKNVLNLYKRFKSYMFMTATPLEDDFILEELKDINVITQTWNDDEKVNVTVKSIKCDNVIASAVKMIKVLMNDSDGKHLYFFVNSVKAIKEIISLAKLDNSNCRAIYSKSNTMNVGVENSSTEYPPKKINFLTSTVFEGCDIYDPEGVTIILSDSYHKNTLLDISTSVQQICGRIRDSKYMGEIYHLYSSINYRDVTYEQYKEHIMKLREKCSKLVTQFNNLDQETREQLVSDNNPYIIKNENNYLEYDPNLPLVDLFNYKTLNTYTSTVTISEEYRTNNMKLTENTDYTKIEDIRLNDGVGINKNFK